jgi:malate/lactate dehydrogenase
MPNVRPVSDLKNYNSVLDEVVFGSPVYLTKDGVDSYVIVDIKDQIEYEKNKAALKLMCELNKGIKSGNENGWLTEDEVLQHINKKFNEA